MAEAYSSAITDIDTGIMWRNQLNLKRVLMTLTAMDKISGRVVDQAGGYGVLVRLLRDAGVDAYWRDKYCQNLLARGFEEDGSPCALMTAFEVFEHLESPLDELKRMLERAPTLLISTELIETEGPPDKAWWYLQPEHGQHIGFFRRRTLEWMADATRSKLLTDGVNLHLFTREAVPESWHRLQRLSRLSLWKAKRKLQPKMMDDFWLLKSAPTAGHVRAADATATATATVRQGN